MKRFALTKPIKVVGLLFLFMFACLYVSGQTITKIDNNFTSKAVCPVVTTNYSVSGSGTCNIKWTVTNGMISGLDNQPQVKVMWNDTPGVIATLKVTLSGCGTSHAVDPNNPLEGASSTLTETVLSVKNQAWDSYGTSVTLDFCTTRSLTLTVPHMYVSGTGDIAQPPRIEVQYAWTIPAGWTEHGSGLTGHVTTTVNTIVIDAVGCAKPGNVTVYGTLAPGQFCSLAANSAIASINLVGANPVITIGPALGYTGSSDCDRNPVTFTASITPFIGCINSLDWHFPAGWTNIIKSSNTVTATPSGTDQDAGQVTATANLSCGTQLTSGPITITFTGPTLISGPYVCGGGTPFTFGNVPSGATISWTASPAYLFNTTSGSFTYNPSGTNSFTLTAHNIYQGGTGASVTATVTTACSAIPLTKSLYVGLPYANATANGQQVAFSYHSPYVDPAYTYNMECSGPLVTINMSVDGATSNGSWQRVSANPTNAYWSILGNNNNMEFAFFAPNQTAVFRFSASNGCGTVAKDYYFKSIDCSGGGGGCNQFAVSPNPSSTMVSIVVPNIPPPCSIAPALATTDPIGEELQNELSIQSVNLIDAEGRNKHSQQYTGKTKKVDLDVSELKKGVYILQVSDGNYIEDHRIVIK